MLSRIIMTIVFIGIMGTWGCGKRIPDGYPEGLPHTKEDLLKGKREIYFEGIIRRDMRGFIYILVKGRPDLYPTLAGLTVCIGGVCESKTVPIMRLRYFKLIVPPFTYLHNGSIPVVVGLRHIKGINPITGYYVYEREPFVERKLILEYRSTVAQHLKLMNISLLSGAQ